MELARTYLITGFPWNLLGYGVQAAGVRQIASVTGVYGLSFLAVATSALLTWVLLSRRHARAGLALTGWLVMLLVAQWSLAPPAEVTGKERAILIQPNVPLDDAALESWVPWRDPTQLQKLVQFSVSAAEYFFPGDAAPGSTSPLGVGLAPGTVRTIQNSKSQIQDAAESSIQSPKSRTQNRPRPQSKIENRKSEIRRPFRRSAIGNRQSAIQSRQLSIRPFWFGRKPRSVFFHPRRDFSQCDSEYGSPTHAIVIVNTIVPLDANGDTISNTAFTIDPEGRELSRYDKIHLVPFGEYVPGWAFPGLVHKITSEVGNFVPGTSYPVAKTPGGNIGVFICYEAIIPQLARKLVANGAGVLVNISNDAWYGDTAAAYQHLEMARLRAIENHRYLLRATNNGLTALIDPYGRVWNKSRATSASPCRCDLIMRRARRFTRPAAMFSHGCALPWGG